MSSNSRDTILKSLQSAKRNTDSLHSLSQLESYENMFTIPSGDVVKHFISEFEALGGIVYKTENFDGFNEFYSKYILPLQTCTPACYEPFLQEKLKKESIVFTEKEPEKESFLVSISSCNSLIANTGTIEINSATANSRKLYVSSEIHIVIAYENQIKATPAEVLNKYSKENLPSIITLITGPSRTADIEKTLILGAHGPKKIFVFLVQNFNA